MEDGSWATIERRMTFEEAVSRFLALVVKVHTGKTARSENDLSANFADCLKALDLSTVLDTSVSSGGRKRPDILGYVRQEDADLVLPAEIVIESKRPDELAEFANLTDAITSGWIWQQKTLPYVRSNITRIQYFGLTTFTEFAVFRITDELRRRFIEWTPEDDGRLRDRVCELVIALRLVPSSDGVSAWRTWIETHFRPQQLLPVPISEIYNAFSVHSRHDLETFAARLAEFAAGPEDTSGGGLFQSISTRLPSSYENLAPVPKRDLHVFLMTQHPGMSLPSIEKLAREHPSRVVTEFVAASIHSLLGRLFAFKAIEDIFCTREKEPLIDPAHWIFASDRYDGRSAEETRTLAFESWSFYISSSSSRLNHTGIRGF
jgi:hypothetical protein